MVEHVVPVGDLIDHDTASFAACVCGPDATPIIVGLTSGNHHAKRHLGWVVIHHSLDGRELQEA